MDYAKLKKITGTVDGYYRGYVEMAGKTPMHAFREGEDSDGYVQPAELVSDLPGWGGVLSRWAGFVDFDDPESAKIAIKMVQDAGLDLPIRLTGKGCHIGFRNTRTGRDGEMIVTRSQTRVMLACGLIADVKIGPNTPEPLVIDGAARDLVYPLENGEPVDLLDYDELPAWLMPVGEPANGWDLDAEGKPGYRSKLIGMTDGDGRYMSLCDLFRRLRQRRVSVDDCRTAVDMCNRYVFGAALSDSELESKGFWKYLERLCPRGRSLQEEKDGETARPTWQDEKGRLANLNLLGNYIRDESALVLIGNAVHSPDEYGIYRNKPKMIRRRALELQADITVQQRDNLEKHLLDACEDVERSDCRYIGFKNGILDIETGRFVEGMPDAARGLILTTLVPHEYHADAPAVEEVDRFLNAVSCGDAGIKDAIEQMWGASLYDCTTGGEMFFCTGKGGTGKTTVERVTKEFLGRENVLGRSLKELSQPFVAYELLNKKAVIGDDISDDYLSGVEESNIKKFFGGFAFNADRKFRDSIEIDNFATGIFSCNSMPTFADKDSGAIDRRVAIIPFDAQFAPGSEGYDPRIIDKLITEPALEYICRLAVDGLNRYITNGLRLEVESQRMDEVREAWLGEQQPLKGWWEDAQDYAAYRPVQKLLDDANAYLVSLGRMKITDKALTKFVKSKGYTPKQVHWRTATYEWQGAHIAYGDKAVTIYMPQDGLVTTPPEGSDVPAGGMYKDNKGQWVPADDKDIPF